MSDEHILPGAFGDKPKTVALTTYAKDGTRHVIGHGTVTSVEGGLRLSGVVVDSDTIQLLAEKEAKDGR